MSTITLTLTSTAVTASGTPLTVTATVTNAATVPARIVLAAFAPTPAPEGATTTGAQAWTTIDRPLRAVAPKATEQFTITVTPPADAPAGDHLVRLIAYDADRAPEEYSDQAQQLRITVPAAAPPAPKPATPWWIWVVAAVLVVVVGVVAFLLLRPGPEPPPPPPSNTPTAGPPTVTFKPTIKLPTVKATIKKPPTIKFTANPVATPTDG
jgi:hypothetical protein